MLEMVFVPAMSVPKDLLSLDHSSSPQLQVCFKGQKISLRGQRDQGYENGHLRVDSESELLCNSGKAN